MSVMEQSPEAAEPARSGAEPPARSTFAPPAKEYMVSFYGGAPYTYPSDVSIKKTGVHNLTVKDVVWRGFPFDNPIYYGYRATRWLDGGSTGVMLDFTHSKAISNPDRNARFEGTMDGQPAPPETRLGDIFRKLEASHGHNMLTLNGLLRLPRISPRIFPYVGFGAGITLPHSEVQFRKNEKRTYEYQYAGPVGQALVGIEFRLPRMSYFVEYKFSLAPYEMPLSEADGSWLPLDLWRQFQNWSASREPPGGRLWTTFTSHQIIAGLSVRTNPAVPSP